MQPGTQLGHYEILSALGKGGMGEVWRARDATLGREVAIKTLPEEFAKDEERLARFEREAKLLASLNHPNIATIHGLEEDNGTRFLVLELVEGDTLADRLKRGAIPVEESLKLALQIAEALEAAHEKGVIHRDLKPANIKVTPDGKIKVLDFGLAKALMGDGADASLSHSPTISMAATQQGVILGTAAYMSPEQARGETTNKRADIWAFGCVLFEMLTGRQTWDGRTVTDVIAGLVAREPEWNSLPPNLHPRLRLVLERCLEKESKDRGHDIADVRVDIQKVLADSTGVLTQPLAEVVQAPPRPILSWVATAVMLTAIVASLAVWIAMRPGPPEPGTVTRLPLDAEGTNSTHGMAWSPDGTRLVYAATVDGVQQLFLWARNQMGAVPIRNTSGALYPFFSHDGEWVGFFTANELKKVSLAGGPAQTLCEVGFRRGATWGPDDTIVFSSDAAPGLMRVSASGGEPQQLTVPEDGEGGHVWPRFLPDGSGVVFTIISSPLNWELAVLSLETDDYRVLTEGTDGSYAASGHMVFAREASLWAAPFDTATLELTGDVVPVVEDVQVNGGGWALYAIAGDGSLAYMPGGTSTSPHTLTWVDRVGREEPVGAPAGDYREPRISPDGSRLAVSLVDATSGNIDVWIWDFERGNMTRLTFDAAADFSPVWAPDGRNVVFFSRRDGAGVYRKAADGTGTDEALISGEPDQQLFPSSVSADGNTLFLTEGESPEVNVGLLALNDDGGRAVLLAESFVEAEAAISPDGRWMAYGSDETGQLEIYVRPFPEVDTGRWQVSTEGGHHPVWSRDGRELFFDDGSAVLVVDVETNDETFRAGIPERVFAGTYDYRNPRRWDVSPDGQRFLMTAFAALATAEQLHIVLNWFEELKEQVPVP